MREYNLLEAGINKNTSRYVGLNLRTINNRISASYRDQKLFDGNRNDGYGGYSYDGRWKRVAEKISKEYNLTDNSKLMQICCEKGFLLNDLKNIHPNISLHGLESSDYAINNSMSSIKKFISKLNYSSLEKYNENEFDFLIAMGFIYSFNLTDAIKHLKNISKISKNSFITLASYDNEDDYWLFKNWTLLGATILKKDEWITVMNHAKYTGDYFFTNAQNLNLQWSDE